MTQQLPPGQGPIDPLYAFTPPAPAGFSAPGFAPGPMPAGPFMSPPPFFPPPRRSNSGKFILIAILLIALVISVIFNFAQISESISATPAARQTILVQGDSANKIAVIPVNGLITDASSVEFDYLLTDVEKDSSAKALVVEIDTPGGSATASDEMYHRLEAFKKKMTENRKFPIIISMRGMATSGGYYVACAGDYIFAENGTLTGNIGVLFPRFNMNKLFEKYGVEETTITATTSGHSYKNAGSMFKPENPEDEKYLQGLVDGTFAQFKQVVQAGRKGKLNDANNDIFSGKAFIASDARDRGLIDALGYPPDAYDYAAAQAGITGNKTVVTFTKLPGLLQSLLSRSTVPSPSASSNVTINGVNIDSNAIGELLTSRPLLLWRGN